MSFYRGTVQPVLREQELVRKTLLDTNTDCFRTAVRPCAQGRPINPRLDGETRPLTKKSLSLGIDCNGKEEQATITKDPWLREWFLDPCLSAHTSTSRMTSLSLSLVPNTRKPVQLNCPFRLRVIYDFSTHMQLLYASYMTFRMWPFSLFAVQLYILYDLSLSSCIVSLPKPPAWYHYYGSEGGAVVVWVGRLIWQLTEDLPSFWVQQ